MDLRYVIATLHLLTFGIGVASIWMRAAALKRLKDEGGIADVLFADNLWGLAAFLWIGTGVWRAFGGIEKGTDFYLHNTAFIIKMTLFLLVFALEIKPMVTFIRWRIFQKKGQTIDLTVAASLARTSYLELLLLIPIVAMAAAMARGILY